MELFLILLAGSAVLVGAYTLGRRNAPSGGSGKAGNGSAGAGGAGGMLARLLPGFGQGRRKQARLPPRPQANVAARGDEAKIAALSGLADAVDHPDRPKGGPGGEPESDIPVRESDGAPPSRVFAPQPGRGTAPGKGIWPSAQDPVADGDGQGGTGDDPDATGAVAPGVREGADKDTRPPATLRAERREARPNPRARPPAKDARKTLSRLFPDEGFDVAKPADVADTAAANPDVPPPSAGKVPETPRIAAAQVEAAIDLQHAAPAPRAPGQATASLHRLPKEAGYDGFTEALMQLSDAIKLLGANPGAASTGFVDAFRPDELVTHLLNIDRHDERALVSAWNSGPLQHLLRLDILLKGYAPNSDPAWSGLQRAVAQAASIATAALGKIGIEVQTSSVPRIVPIAGLRSASVRFEVRPDLLKWRLARESVDRWVADGGFNPETMRLVLDVIRVGYRSDRQRHGAAVPTLGCYNSSQWQTGTDQR